MKLLIKKKQIVFLLVLFASFISFSQTKTITGIVYDDLNKPLESVNIIASPYNKESQLKFAIADNKGRYKLELDAAVKYEITASYIGYKEEILTIEPNSTITYHNFVLKSTGQKLKEIVIKNDYKPLVIKKDTMTFNVKSFANGNERKMKEILEKLPGVEVDKKGNVTVQGKKVTQMLVEGKSFFGGGSKLAVENIPADALDKIEVIDHFNTVGFMKNVSDSEELAMNVKLKADKKKFVFGDIEAAAEIANDNSFYLAHTGLFYYSPKTNISYIGDSNNIGESTFTFEDLIRFDGGVSSFLSGRKSFTNLFNFANDNNDVVENKSNFSALNFSVNVSQKLAVSGYGIFSKVFTKTYYENQNTYIENTFSSSENRLQDNSNKTTLGIANIKLDYSPNIKEKWFYNIQLQASNNNGKNSINSTTASNNTLFETISNSDNSSLKQYIEWHKSYNDNHTNTFVVNHAFEKNTPTMSWFTNQLFLSGFIPLQTDSQYHLEQIKNVQNNSIDALFKHYWIVNDFNHLYAIIGNNYGNSKLFTSENQYLTNGTVNDFTTNGFGNDIDYKLNDSYFGLEYKFKIGKWTNKPAIYVHWYNLITNQFNAENKVSKNLMQPQFNSKYEFSQSETLEFNYKLSNTFAEVSQYATNFTLQNYNLVFKGNALLANEQFHNANLRYQRTNMYRGITVNAVVDYNKKIKSIRNTIQLVGIDQFTTPIITDNPETTWRLNGSFGKKIYRFNFKINPTLNWFNYIQTINNSTTSTNRNSQNLGFSIRTAYRKWPDVSLGYKKGYNQLIGITNSSYTTDEFNGDFEISFLKSFNFKFEYENYKNNSSNRSNFFEIANTSVSYQKKNKPLLFKIFVNNLLNNKIKVSNSFSDYLITEQKTYILPRVFMLSISYKL